MKIVRIGLRASACRLRETRGGFVFKDSWRSLFFCRIVFEGLRRDFVFVTFINEECATMSGLTDKPDATVSSPTRLRSPWRFGMTGWTLILGLLALNLGVLHEYVGWDKRVLGWLLYRIDPRYWPVWPSALLWGIFCWKLNNVLKNRFRFVAEQQYRIKPGIVIVTILYACWLAGWMGLRFRRMVYQLYLLHIIAPGAQYAIDGTLSLKLLIAPTLGLIVIASLIYVAYLQRKKRHESTIKYENNGDAED